MGTKWRWGGRERGEKRQNKRTTKDKSDTSRRKRGTNRPQYTRPKPLNDGLEIGNGRRREQKAESLKRASQETLLLTSK